MQQPRVCGRALDFCCAPAGRGLAVVKIADKKQIPFGKANKKGKGMQQSRVRAGALPLVAGWR